MRQRGSNNILCNWIGEPVHKRGPVACVLFLLHFLSMGKRNRRMRYRFFEGFLFPSLLTKKEQEAYCNRVL